jgi:hypothetical protein
MTDLPIACTLSSDALRARKQGLLARVAGKALVTAKIDGGYRLEFTPDSEMLPLIAEMISAERQCCRFLQFTLRVDADLGPITLEMTGPRGTQEFLEALFDNP